MTHLDKKERETGLGFFIVEGTLSRLYAVLSDGAALPLQSDSNYYDIEDLLSGIPVPEERDSNFLALGSSLPTRALASTRLSTLSISSSYSGGTGAVPLIGSATLATSTVFYRYIQSSADHRYDGQNLTAGTYLTTQLELPLANTGFAAVGRFALPLPLPACHVIHYELPAGTFLNIGTVAPLFGQAGGGVEVCLPKAQQATNVGAHVLPPF
jgi:hypothetical protein